MLSHALSNGGVQMDHFAFDGPRETLLTLPLNLDLPIGALVPPYGLSVKTSLP